MAPLTHPNPHQAQTLSVLRLLAHIHTRMYCRRDERDDPEWQTTSTPCPHTPLPASATYLSCLLTAGRLIKNEGPRLGCCGRVLTERCLFAVVGSSGDKQLWGLTWWPWRGGSQGKTITVGASSCSQWMVSFINEAVVFLNNNHPPPLPRLPPVYSLLFWLMLTGPSLLFWYIDIAIHWSLGRRLFAFLLVDAVLNGHPLPKLFIVFYLVSFYISILFPIIQICSVLSFLLLLSNHRIIDCLYL